MKPKLLFAIAAAFLLLAVGCEKSNAIVISTQTGTMRCESQAIVEDGDTIPHGYIKYWNKNGSLHSIGHACRGVPCDAWEWMDEHGRIGGMVVYKDGDEAELINFEYYDTGDFYIKVFKNLTDSLREVIYVEAGDTVRADTIKLCSMPEGLNPNSVFYSAFLNCELHRPKPELICR